jgi:hypothetical protein
MHPAQTYKDVAEIEAIVYNFENCRFAKDEFTHARHLTVAAYYLSHFPGDEAHKHMRESLLRFTGYHCVSAYHETITRFWMKLTDDFLRQQPKDTPFHEQVNLLIKCFCRKDLVYDYYSRERLKSDEAKHGWLEPDLQPLAADKVQQ